MGLLDDHLEESPTGRHASPSARSPALCTGQKCKVQDNTDQVGYPYTDDQVLITEQKHAENCGTEGGEPFGVLEMVANYLETFFESLERCSRVASPRLRPPIQSHFRAKRSDE